MLIEYQLFSEDCKEELTTFKAILQTIKPQQENKTQIDTMFRIVHTIKGGASMVEFDEIIHFTHTLEDLLEAIRIDKISIDENIIALLTNIQSHLNIMIEEHVQEKQTLPTQEQTQALQQQMHTTIKHHTYVLPQIVQSLEKVAQRSAKTLGKKINFDINLDPNFDQMYIQQIYNPLIQLVKNAIAHGIELPKNREAKNKSQSGKITLSFTITDTDYVIQLQDDGMGINKTSLHQKAIALGIITAEQNLQEKETFDLMFSPGLSTAKELSTISGRGVGMDIVKEKLQSFSATIDIQSQTDLGTTITIKIPRFEQITKQTPTNLNTHLPLRAFEKF